ncbi:MAG: hypothetical protein ACHBN1_20865 [Heteroscytonema crispum UTEX LB 1556]
MGIRGEGERGRWGDGCGATGVGVGDKEDFRANPQPLRASPVLGGKPSRSTGEPPTNNPRGVHQSPGSGKRHCDPWPDPKTAVAPLPRARSSPEGIFPTADASAPSPPTNNQLPTTFDY